MAIHHAIREHKDDKLFYCSNQFSTIFNCNMSHGPNGPIFSIISPFSFMKASIRLRAGAISEKPIISNINRSKQQSR